MTWLLESSGERSSTSLSARNMPQGPLIDPVIFPGVDQNQPGRILEDSVEHHDQVVCVASALCRVSRGGRSLAVAATGP